MPNKMTFEYISAELRSLNSCHVTLNVSTDVRNRFLLKRIYLTMSKLPTCTVQSNTACVHYLCEVFQVHVAIVSIYKMYQNHILPNSTRCAVEFDSKFSVAVNSSFFLCSRIHHFFLIMFNIINMT